jgi:hypothetical protein
MSVSVYEPARMEDDMSGIDLRKSSQAGQSVAKSITMILDVSAKSGGYPKYKIKMGRKGREEISTWLFI